MATITKKSWKKEFEEILNGKKKFEVRLGDLDINEGDTIILKEYDNKEKKETGREIRKKVNFVRKTKEMGYWSEEDKTRHGFTIMQLED